MSYFSKTAFAILAAIWILARFYSLEIVPNGFYVDEATGAGHILCLSETGSDINGQDFPLFTVAIPPGYTTPFLLYAGVCWVKLFGSSVFSFRSLIALLNLLTALAVFLISHNLISITSKQDQQTASSDRVTGWACFATFLFLLSPWAFQQARIFWDPPLGLLFFT